jgi:hypothetical protein
LALISCFSVIVSLLAKRIPHHAAKEEAA